MAWSLNTRMLRMLLAIADAGSAAKAAAALNVSASALSHQIRQAEDMLRVRLFDRINGRLQPTSVTEDLIRSARIVVAEMDEAERNLDRRRNGLRPLVRLSGGAYPVHRWVIPMLQQAGAPNLPDVSFVCARSLPLPRAVAEGQLDVAIVAGEPRERGTVAIPLFPDALVAILPVRHALTSRDFLDAADLSPELYITYSRRIEDGFEDDRLFRPARKAPARFLEASSVDAIVEWVAAGAGFSILSRWAVQGAVAERRVEARALTAGGLPIRWWALIRGSGPEATAPGLLARFMAETLGAEPPSSRAGPSSPS